MNPAGDGTDESGRDGGRPQEAGRQHDGENPGDPVFHEYSFGKALRRFDSSGFKERITGKTLTTIIIGAGALVFVTGAAKRERRIH